MPQHSRITDRQIQEILDNMESANYHSERDLVEDLLVILPEIDQFLVRHNNVILARKLRKSLSRFGGIY